MQTKKIEKLQSMLLEDDFIRFITMNAKRMYIIDSKESKFNIIPNIIGVFKSEDNWTVYETTRRQQIHSVAKFEEQIDAYQDAAARDNLSYQPSEIIKDIEEIDKIDTNKDLLKIVKNMIFRLESDKKFYHDEEIIDQYQDDLSFLNDIVTPEEIKKSKIRK